MTCWNDICHSFPAIRHNTFLSAPALQQKRRKRAEKKEEGGVEALINEEKCIVPVLWADEKDETRYKADSATVKLQGADMHKMHTSGDKNGEKQVGIANQYISDYLLNAVWKNMSLHSERNCASFASLETAGNSEPCSGHNFKSDFNPPSYSMTYTSLKVSWPVSCNKLRVAERSDATFNWLTEQADWALSAFPTSFPCPNTAYSTLSLHTRLRHTHCIIQQLRIALFELCSVFTPVVFKSLW